MPNRLPVLSRFDMIFTKAANPPADLTQVVVTGKTVRVFQQGATVSTNNTPGNLHFVVNAENTVNVFHTGAAVKTTGVMGVNGVDAKSLSVTGISPPGSLAPWLKLKNTSGQVLDLNGLDRLHVVTPSTGFWNNPLQTGPLSVLITDLNGRAVGYVADYRYDIALVLDVNAPEMYIDLVGSWVMR